MEWNMEENFSMEWNMEENFSMEWKIFGMEWKKIVSMEYGKIVFHSIPCPDCRGIVFSTNLHRFEKYQIDAECFH